MWVLAVADSLMRDGSVAIALRKLSTIETVTGVRACLLESFVVKDDDEDSSSG